MVLALPHDTGKMALRLGNSPELLLTHFPELVTREEARRFWGLIGRAATI